MRGAVVWRGHPAGSSAQRACRFCWIPGPSLLLTFSVRFLAQTFKLSDMSLYMLSFGLSQARERNPVEASVIAASVAETAPGWLHPRDGAWPTGLGRAAQGLTPTLGPLP